MIPNKLSGFGSPKQRIPDAYCLVCLVQEVNFRDHIRLKNLLISAYQGIVILSVDYTHEVDPV